MRHALILGAGVLVALVPCGCRVPRNLNAGPGGVRVTDLGGYVEFVARARDNDQKSKVSASRTKSTERTFEENLKLEADGYAYHPNLLEFTIGGVFGLLQNQYEEDFSGRQRTSSDSGTVLEFDLNTHFFKKKEYPGSVFARRYSALTPRPFQSSLQTTTTNYGLTWQYLSAKMPTSFQFSHTDVELDPLDSAEARSRQKNTVFRFETAYNFSNRNKLKFRYNRDSISQEPFTLDYDTDEFTLSHDYLFGQSAAHRLESEANLYKQKGSFNIDRFRWRETLRLQHTENLRSWYRFEFVDRTQGSLSGVPPIEERSYLISGTVEHKLFESLVSQLYGYLQTQGFGSGLDIDRAGAQASFDYRKRNPWGVLLATYRIRVQRESRTGTGQFIEIVDERRTFRDPAPVTLAQTGIEVGSITLTALDTITFFQAGRDYLVQPFPDRIEIRRVATGRIADGQTVLVDYIFAQGGDFDLDTFAQDFFIQQRFNFGLTPYYRLRWQDQTISPATATSALANDITDQIVGVEFDRWSLRLSAEYEDNDQTINPFTAVRLTGNYRYKFKWNAVGTIRARWSDFSFTEPVRDTTLFTLEGRYRHPLTRHLVFEGAVIYRNEDDTISLDKEGLDLDLSLEWRIRQTEVMVTYETRQFEDSFAENDNSVLYVQVRRRF